ncbi:hypothetical protein [Nodosilinea nodulosa]|nr:hypothetical protein [Nodosilinea nodulosa]
MIFDNLLTMNIVTIVDLPIWVGGEGRAIAPAQRWPPDSQPFR